MSTETTGTTYHVIQMRGLGNVPLYPRIQTVGTIALLTYQSTLPPTTAAVVTYVELAIAGVGGGGGEGDSSSGGLTRWGEWEARSTSTEYTAATNGWLRVSNISPGSVSVTVDGVVVFQGTHQDDSGMSYVKVGTLIPIFEGQVYYIEGDTMNPTFAPCV